MTEKRGIPRTKIKIHSNGLEHNYNVYGHIDVKTVDNGKTTLTAHDVEDAGWLSCAKIEGYSRDESALCDPPVDPTAEAMIAAAREAEQATLVAAAMIQDAKRGAQRLVEDYNHLLNQAILAYMHTGKSNMDATKVLEGSGIYASEDRTEAVACAMTHRLYGVDKNDLGL
jgi:hypothetical protein